MSDTVNTNFLHGLTSFKISSSCKGRPNLDSKAKLDWILTVKSKARVLIVRVLTCIDGEELDLRADCEELNNR